MKVMQDEKLLNMVMLLGILIGPFLGQEGMISHWSANTDFKVFDLHTTDQSLVPVAPLREIP